MGCALAMCSEMAELMSGSHLTACFKYICICIFNYTSVFSTGTSQQGKGFTSWEASGISGLSWDAPVDPAGQSCSIRAEDATAGCADYSLWLLMELRLMGWPFRQTDITCSFFFWTGVWLDSIEGCGMLPDCLSSLFIKSFAVEPVKYQLTFSFWGHDPGLFSPADIEENAGYIKNPHVTVIF